MTENVLLQSDGYNHAHAFVRIRGSTVGALLVVILGHLHLPVRPLIATGPQGHHPDCTPGPDGIAVGEGD